MEADRKTIIPTPLLVAFLVCGGLVIFGCVLTPYFTARPGQDQSSYLFEAQRLLSGAELYGPHLAETNPPMIVWFSTIPVVLGHWLHVSSAFFLRLVVMGLIIGSTTWCVRILRRGTAVTNPVSIGLLACATLAVEFGIGPYNFGQREQLLIILLLPYILAAATGAVSRLSLAERCALGVAAGVAIWFKPQDVVVVVGLELFLALRHRGVRRVIAPEFLSMVLTSTFVLVLMRVFTPLYGSVTLPLLFDTYWALGTVNTLTLALSFRGYVLLVLVLLVVCFVLRRSLRDPGTSAALLICSAGAFYAFAIQHNNWWYHAYPHQVLLLLGMAYLLTDFLYPILGKLSSDSPLRRRVMLGASLTVAVLLCAIAFRPRAVLTAGTHSQSDVLDDFLAQYKPSTTVYVFSTNIAPLSFAFNHGLNWGSRFAHLWMLPGIIQNETGPIGPPAPFKRLSPERVTSLADLLRSESAEDLRYWRPSVVIVERCSLNHFCQGMTGKEFDMLAWFLQSPGFAAAWSHYQKQTAIDNDNYDVYRLVP